jgi:hypothetical protein
MQKHIKDKKIERLKPLISLPVILMMFCLSAFGFGIDAVRFTQVEKHPSLKYIYE